MQKVKFTCPKCGSYLLEEVMVNVAIGNSISGLAIDNNGVAYWNFSKPSFIEDGDCERFQCGDCGKFLKINDDVVNDFEGLALWFKQNGAQK